MWSRRGTEARVICLRMLRQMDKAAREGIRLTDREAQGGIRLTDREAQGEIRRRGHKIKEIYSISNLIMYNKTNLKEKADKIWIITKQHLKCMKSIRERSRPSHAFP